ncbi:MAG: leucine-rich repeat domain-containing protein [Clostridia bacterium]|nr:leucine-rich repeat domain-containing protein [Clostridia bacterium]
MKKLLITSLLLITLLLAGCTPNGAETVTPQPSTDERYQAQILELEAKLQQEREAKFISDTAYENRIKALEKQLALLAPDDEVDTSPENGMGELVFTYRLEGDHAIITNYTGTSPLVTVPSHLDGHPVIAIGERAFEGKSIAAVILPEGVETIGWFAFYGCEGLIDVTIPTSVTGIGYAVFDGCPNLSIVCAGDSYAAQYADSYGIPRIST